MTNISSGINDIKDTVERFGIRRPLAQLVFLQVRLAVGGITNEELVAYRRITTLIMDSINKDESSEQGIESFHVKTSSKDKKFKNRHMAIMLEAITANYYIDFFGEDVAKAIVEQDERFLNTIMAERLPDDFGNSVIIVLTGNIDRDVETLNETVNLLTTRRLKDLAISQPDKIKLRHRNPWQAIRQGSVEEQTNHLVVNYVDSTQQVDIDLDLLQQMLFVLGQLKRIQRKDHEMRAVLKLAENKRIYEKIHKDLPKEQEVYHIQPDRILGHTQPASNDTSADAKTIDPDGRPKTISDSNKIKIKEQNHSNSNSNELSKKHNLLQKFRSNLSKLLPESEMQKQRKLESEILAKRLSTLENHYLTHGIDKSNQPDLSHMLEPNYDIGAGDAFKGIKSIEAILDASLNDKDDINPNKLNYSSIDVTSGVFVTINWKSVESDFNK